MYYHDVIHYWVKAFYTPPFFRKDGAMASLSSHYKKLYVPKDLKKEIAAILSSSTFYIWYISKSNGRDFSKDDLLEFNIDIEQLKKNESVLAHLLEIGESFIDDLDKNKQRVTYNKKSGTVEYDQYWVSKSKSIIDEIDTLLAKHYGFTDEELDFIVNYDIKYRMGKELESEDEE